MIDKTTEVSRVVEVVDFDPDYQDSERTIAVNWAAIGWVSPYRARQVAASLLKAADIVESRMKKAKATGKQVRHSAR